MSQKWDVSCALPAQERIQPEKLAVFLQGRRYLHAYISWWKESAPQRLCNPNSGTEYELGEGGEKKKSNCPHSMPEEHHCRRKGQLTSQENCSRAKSQIPLQGLNLSLFCAFCLVLTKKTVFPWISVLSDTAGFAAQSWKVPELGRADEVPMSH